MALRNYLLDLMSDCAETNETDSTSINVTIVSDNSFSHIDCDTSTAGIDQYPIRCASDEIPSVASTEQERDAMTTTRRRRSPKPSPKRTITQGTPERLTFLPPYGNALSPGGFRTRTRQYRGSKLCRKCKLHPRRDDKPSIDIPNVFFE